jgi:hypothetical protein
MSELSAYAPQRFMSPRASVAIFRDIAAHIALGMH